MVWDIGTFEIVEGNYWKGRLSVFLNGAKLKGEWMLERSGDANDKRKWLLRKVDDKRRRISATKLERSALTNRSIEEIAKAADALREKQSRAERPATPRDISAEQSEKGSQGASARARVRLAHEGDFG
jgi:hypothetical protein